MLPLTEKYRPKNIAELQGQEAVAKRVLEFCKNYKAQKKRAILLHGPAGVGKTTIALAVAGELDLEVVELNASDVRNASSIKELLGPAMQQQSLFGRGKIILFDEIDGLSGNKDRGGTTELLSLMKESTFPVILTANDAYSKKLSSIRRYCEVLEVKTSSWRSVLAMLNRIADAEGILHEEGALEAIARRAGGDLRGAITDLQTVAGAGIVEKTTIGEMSGRRQAETMFAAMQRILKGSDAALAREAVDLTDEDIDTLLMWIDENLPKEYTGADLAAAYEQLSRADVFRGRILRWQHWRFLVYVIDLSTSGVALAKTQRPAGFTKYSPPQRLLTYWRAKQANAKRDAIAEKLAQAQHTSKKAAIQDALPYLSRAMLADDALAAELELSSDEREWLAKQQS